MNRDISLFINFSKQFRLFLSSVSLAPLLLSNLQAADASILKARITNVVNGFVYVDVGSSRGIKHGEVGRVIKHGIEINQAEVVTLDTNSAQLNLLVNNATEQPAIGDRVFFQIDISDVKVESSEFEQRNIYDGEETSGEPDPLPLLSPISKRKMGYPTIANIFHGKAKLRQLFQVDSENNLDYSLTRLGVDASVERISGTPWNFEGDLDIRYRTGEAFESRDDFEEPRFDFDEAFFERKIYNIGFLRLGRFLPSELSSIGYIDGIQLEVPLNNSINYGTVVGLKPDRENLDFSIDEPTITAYLSAESGTPRELYYTGTLGVHGSMFDGSGNRLAILLDQRVNIGPKFNIYSSSEIDLDIGESKFNNGLSLTRLNIHATSPIHRVFTLRAGVDHYERPDIPSERDLLPFENEEFFDTGYWRYWIGGSHRLPLKLRLTEQITFIDPAGGKIDERWRLSLSRRGLPWNPSGNLSVSVYSLSGLFDDGYGGYLSGYLSFLHGKVTMSPRCSFRMLEDRSGSTDLEVTNYSIYTYLYLNKKLSFNVGFTHTTGDSLNSTLIDLGLVQRW